ncbi:MAG: biotin synthase, partial [Tolumonas sp.]|nr:biotin synthase [Tolumonas sp.]
LSAGREKMNDQMQALCFMAGANSIFYGCKLLTTPNADANEDMQLFARLGLKPEARAQKPDMVEEHALMEAIADQAEGALFYDASKPKAQANAV